MRRLVAVLLTLGLALTALPAVAPAAPRTDAGVATAAAKKKPKKKKRKSTAKQRCLAKAKKVKSKRKRARAIRACNRRYARKPAVNKPVAPPAPAKPPFVDGGVQDATVIAVLDFGLNPYHWDFLASKMPQNSDADPRNDLPLDRSPSEWLPGFRASEFASVNRLDLTLEAADREVLADDLRSADAEKWDTVKASTLDQRNLYWFPHTKVIGAMTYLDDNALLGSNGDHGVGTTSSSVGNLHGTCPECLLFFIQLGEGNDEIEGAIDWAMKQPWIDAISNSYGLSLTPADRTRIYDGSSVDLQRQASERGQTIFFSAGNGNEGAFVAPNNTTFSSQEGPDWIVTVGAVSPPGDGYYEPLLPSSDSQQSGYYTGAGKPADVAGVGSDYPTAYTATTVGGTGESGFGGTSNATPEVAGLYGRTLHTARKLLRGPSRSQEGGVVAAGQPFACGPVRPACELADGKLTAVELRNRLFMGAEHSPAGGSVYTQGAGDQTLPQVGEEEFMSEGHGAYLGRVSRDRNAWLAEFERLSGPLTGAGKELVRPDGEREWMIVDSYCRQRNWGAWPHGYYVEGQTPLPGQDPAWPARSQREASCVGGPTPP